VRIQRLIPVCQYLKKKLKRILEINTYGRNGDSNNAKREMVQRRNAHHKSSTLLFNGPLPDNLRRSFTYGRKNVWPKKIVAPLAVQNSALLDAGEKLAIELPFTVQHSAQISVQVVTQIIISIDTKYGNATADQKNLVIMQHFKI
jgi:hypothetical protein